MSEKAQTNLPRHATHGYHTGLAVFGAVLGLIGATGMFITLTSPEDTLHVSLSSLVCLGFGVLLFVLGIASRGLGAGVQIVNTSFERIGRGRFTEAEALLDEAERRHKQPLVQRVAAVQRGLIAMRRGKLDEALAALDRGIESKRALLNRAQLRIQGINARGIRAFVRAAAGDRKGARADIEAVRQSPEALPQALARAALAEAILIERAGDREVLREHLAQHHELLFDVTDRRERAIVRAYQRKLETTATSIYRKEAKRDAESEEPPLADWIAQVVPEAAPFVASNAIREKTGDLQEAGHVSPSAKKAVEDARKQAASKQPSRVRLVLAIWAACIGIAVGLWNSMGQDEPRTGRRMRVEPPPDPLPYLSYAVIGVFTLLIGLMVSQQLKARKATRRLFHALTLVAKGDATQGSAELTDLTKSRFFLIAAQAHLALAAQAERAGELNTALQQADLGLARLSRYVTRISASDILLPDLISQRAFVLAAMDRVEEAEAELASLPPAYPFMSRALYRVRLVARSRAGDLQGAATLAAQAGLDLPLACRDELLTDVLRAIASPESIGAVEIARLRRELRTSKELRHWMKTVAPKVLVAFEKAAEESIAPAPSAEEAEAETRAEEEARAVAEAQQEAPTYLASTVSK